MTEWENLRYIIQQHVNVRGHDDDLIIDRDHALAFVDKLEAAVVKTQAWIDNKDFVPRKHNGQVYLRKRDRQHRAEDDCGIRRHQGGAAMIWVLPLFILLVFAVHRCSRLDVETGRRDGNDDYGSNRGIYWPWTPIIWLCIIGITVCMMYGA